MKYVTTNVRLEEDLHRKLKHLAVERGKSAAELIRSALRTYLNAPPSDEKSPRPEDDPFWEVIGSCDTGIRDGSINHDHYLYGLPKVEEREKGE